MVQISAEHTERIAAKKNERRKLKHLMRTPKQFGY